MKILSQRNNKDYYDYLSGIYGIDEKVVYDRRKYTVLATSDSPLFTCISLKTDKPLHEEMRYFMRKFNRLFIKTGVEYCCVLEVGNKHFIFAVNRFLDMNGRVCFDWLQLDSDKCYYRRQRYGTAPMTLFQADFGGYFQDKTPHISIKPETGISNPIIKDTRLTSFITAQEIYDALYEYLSSLNDKEIIDTRTDIQKAESAGFDCKTSFRNIKD